MFRRLQCVRSQFQLDAMNSAGIRTSAVHQATKRLHTKAPSWLLRCDLGVAAAAVVGTALQNDVRCGIRCWGGAGVLTAPSRVQQ